ncbi:MAG: hypothetical protein NC485_08935 [Ruminococcus flavefaciens]|nr:hypothetical protein [Ruminococcus flavefaciens]MCM1060147.1 hypothetical protein [Eubacterium sp.]
MKKILALLAACMTLTTAFVSCGYSDDDGKSSEKKSKSSVSDDADDAKSSSKKDKDSDSSDDDDSNSTNTSDSSQEQSTDDKSDDDNSGHDYAANAYAEAIYGKNAAQTYYKLILPDECIDLLKEGDEWDDAIDEYNDAVEEILEEYSIEIKAVENLGKLTKSQLDCVEEYFSIELDLEGVTASKGYKYHIEIEGTDLESGETEIDEGEVCIVKLKEGWKVIEETAEDLEYYYSE